MNHSSVTSDAVLLFALYRVGDIWTFQVVLCPLSSLIRTEDFPAYHNAHFRSIFGVIFVPMGLSAVSAVLLKRAAISMIKATTSKLKRQPSSGVDRLMSHTREPSARQVCRLCGLLRDKGFAVAAGAVDGLGVAANAASCGSNLRDRH